MWPILFYGLLALSLLGWLYTALRQARRIRLLCDGYGLEDRSELLDTVVARMQAMHDLLVAGTDASAIRLVEEGHHLSALEDAAWVREQRAALAAEL